MAKIRLNRGDVTVEKLEDSRCDGPDECNRVPTHGVWVDFRTSGLKQRVGKYCWDCARGVMRRIRNGLPRR